VVWQAIKEIKKDKELSLIPIIIISTDELISKKLKTSGSSMIFYQNLFKP